MSKKGNRGILKLRNTLYRRFVLTNRGYTPFSIKTKKLNFSIDWEGNKRIIYSTQPYSRRSGRIYKIGDRDFRFDFSRYNAGKDLLYLSSHLDRTGVGCGEVIDGKIVYYFPFDKGLSEKNDFSNKMRVEESLLFYPGYYYTRGIWCWTETLSNLLKVYPGVNTSFSNTYLYSTDYTTCDIGTGAIINGMSFIFVPYDKASTTSLQAYLPLSLEPRLFQNYIKPEDLSNIDILNSIIVWMGKRFSLFTFHNSSYEIETYSSQYTATFPQGNNTGYKNTLISTIQSIFQSKASSLGISTSTIYYYASSSLNTSVFVDSTTNSYGIPNDVTVPFTSPKLYVDHVYKKSNPLDIPDRINTNSWNMSISNLVRTENFTVLDNSNTGRYAYLYAIMKFYDSSPHSIYGRVFIGREFENIPTTETVTGNVVDVRNNRMNDSLRKILFTNSSPIDSQFSHLSRVN